ncbi:MAG: hypothetical protein CBD91_06705 [Phycisphaeraceae bacterium TMED231]|nr:MAG: hypothetical protein CBD91_06705 [Phycisphaeraceae bacterium TMED231]
MIHDQGSQSELESENGVRGRVFLFCFIFVFGASVVGTWFFGLDVVRNVKAQAVRSDTALRTVGYAILVATSEAEAFPLDVSEIVDREFPAAIPGPLAEADPDPEAGWPATLEAAMAGMEPVPLSDALELVLVSWPPEPDLPPVLSVGGRPSGMIDARSTLDIVNGWLRNAGVRLAN